MPAERELHVGARFECGPALLFEATDLGLRKAFVGDVGERRPAPQPEGLPERVGGRYGVLVDQGPAAGDQLLEDGDIELTRVDIQPVCAALSLEPPVASQLPAQSRNLVVEHLVGGGRRRLAPQVLHQPVPRHRLVSPQQQEDQEGALSPGSDRELARAVIDYLKRAKQAEIHLGSP